MPKIAGDFGGRPCAARLAGSRAFTDAVTDYAYKAAGVRRVFSGRPFERGFRDLHTLPQRIKSHDARYETASQNH